MLALCSFVVQVSSHLAADWAIPTLPVLLPLVDHIFTNSRVPPAPLLKVLTEFVHHLATNAVNLYEYSTSSTTNGGLLQGHGDSDVMSWSVGDSLLRCVQTLVKHHTSLYKVTWVFKIFTLMFLLFLVFPAR